MSGNLIARRRPECPTGEVRLPDINEGGFSWTRTQTSTMFAAIGYDATHETLRVVFRDSGTYVEYTKFNGLRWHYFKRAKSLGRHWKAYIRTLEGSEINVKDGPQAKHT